MMEAKRSEDATTLLVLKMEEEASSQGMQVPQGARKRKGTNYHLALPKGTTNTLIFIPLRLILHIWPPEF